MKRRMLVFWAIVIVAAVFALAMTYWIFWVLGGPI